MIEIKLIDGGNNVSLVHYQAQTYLLVQFKSYFVYAVYSIKHFVSNMCVPYGKDGHLNRINGKFVSGKVKEANYVKDTCCFFPKVRYLVEK